MSENSFVSTSWHSYPSIWALGHRQVQDLLLNDVVVEEKVDGSQFSFGYFPELTKNGEHELRVKSKGAVMPIDAPQAMFRLACETVKKLHEAGLLKAGWTYRGEVLCKPKHNTLVYNRVPVGNVILFDINPAHEVYLDYADKAVEAARLGLEVVPALFSGIVGSAAQLRELFERESILGGQKIEGVVIKPVGYKLFGEDKKAILGKFVSEAFKEAHSKAWKESNPTRSDIVEKLIEGLRSPARWQKAVMHLAERGELEFAPKDIGKLIKEAQADILKEEKDEITEALFNYFAPKITRGAVAGLPEWYKQYLLERQFEEEAKP